MNIKNIIIALVAAVVLNVLVVTAISSVIVDRAISQLPLGGGAGEAYSYKNLTSADASATVPVVIRRDGGVLGSITIASSSPAFTGGGQGIRIYDACCTATSTATSTLIATIKSNASEQTFNFDIAFKNGLVIDVPVGFIGSYVITTQP